MGDYITTKEAEPKVHLSQHHIAELARQGRIKAQRSGKKWLVEIEPKGEIYELVYLSGAEVVSAPSDKLDRLSKDVIALRQEIDARRVLAGDWVELDDTPPPEI